MNKLIISVVALCNIFSLIAMEDGGLIAITQLENEHFARHTQMAVNYSYKVVIEQKISADNALHIITHKYSESLRSVNNNLSELIKLQGLQDRLEEFKKFELDKLVVEAKKRLAIDGSDVEAKRNLTERRNVLAGLNLETKQPTYSKPLKGEVQTDARIEFMKRNKNYPLEEEAIKDYIATLIYQFILARRTTIYDNIR